MSNETNIGNQGRRKGIMVVLAVAAAIAIAIGSFIAGTLMSPQSTELRADNQSLTDRVERLRGERDAAEAAAAQTRKDVADQKAAQDAKEEELVKRESALVGAEQTQKKNTVGPGTWRVGTDMAPGTYVSKEEVTTEFCNFTVTDGPVANLSRDSMPLQAGFGPGRHTVAVADGNGFQSRDCGDWILQQQ